MMHASQLWSGNDHDVTIQNVKCAHCPLEYYKMTLYRCKCGFVDACKQCIREHISEERKNNAEQKQAKRVTKQRYALRPEMKVYE